MQNNPQVVFERLFGDGSTDAERQRPAAAVAQPSGFGVEARWMALKKKLPASRSQPAGSVPERCARNRAAHRESRRSSCRTTQASRRAHRHSGRFRRHIKLMFDLQVLAWQADITRITTLLMAKELSGAVYPKSGIRDAFHILSHHSNQPENMDRLPC